MIHIDQAIIVEGKYDRMRLSEVTDAPIVEAGGFNLFHDEEKQSLIKKFSETTGIIILTDSDPAGGKLVQDLVPERVVAELCEDARRAAELRKRAADVGGRTAELG